MKHEPLSRQRSPWVGRPDQTMHMTDGDVTVTAHWFVRIVGDGSLWACVAQEPEGWHLSISFRNQRDEMTRYPTWDEQVHAVRELLPSHMTFHMILPPDDDGYVNLHPTTFHWHEYTEELP